MSAAARATSGRLVGEAVRGERVVAVHGRANAGVRHPAEGDRGFEPRVDGRPAGERSDPAFEGVVCAAEGERPEPVAVIVRVHHGGEGEEVLLRPPPARRGGSGLDRPDPAVLHLDHRIAERGLPPGRGEEPAERERPCAHAAPARASNGRALVTSNDVPMAVKRATSPPI